MTNSVCLLRKLATLMAVSVVMVAGSSSCTQNEPSDYRDAFTGTYTGMETWNNGGMTMSNDHLTVTVSKSSVSADRIVISSTFYVDALTESFDAVVSKDGNFTGSFPGTLYGASNLIDIKNGRFTGLSLSYNYSAQSLVTCQVNVTKR